jgi:hypothetical protein
LLAEWLRAGWCVPDRDGPSGEEMP